MNINIRIGSIKIVSMATASTFAIGQSGIANRNNSKANTGPSAIGEGIISMPMRTQWTNDPDRVDNVEFAGDNILTPPSDV